MLPLASTPLPKARAFLGSHFGAWGISFLIWAFIDSKNLSSPIVYKNYKLSFLRGIYAWMSFQNKIKLRRCCGSLDLLISTE